MSTNLTADANDPGGDTLAYHYSVTRGRIVGRGASVTWDLSGVDGGLQTATVRVINAHGGTASAHLDLSLDLCPNCDPGCPALSVTGPASMNDGQAAIFRAAVPGGSGKLNYQWSVVNGEIVGKENSKEVRVKAKGQPGDQVILTVEVGGLEPACSRTATASSVIQKPK